MNMRINRNTWLFCRKHKPDASMRLFCFPFGGGGASVYHSWGDAMGDDVETFALQLPGREARYKEPAVQDIDTLIKEIVKALQDYQDKPYAIFGYSLGSLLAFEVARQLRKQGMNNPVHLYIAALRAPQTPPVHPPISKLEDSEFIRQIENFYQPDNEAWHNLELREFILPLLKGDLALYENYNYEQDSPLNCPVDIFMGDSDDSTPVELAEKWSELIIPEIQYHIFKGGHFFIDTSLNEIQNIVSISLSQK